ncbi:MAG: hypothetical protein B6241_03250 [Spirochaetaceae bacterium 4572_59]|nr:MAG: hypothetical protein B6241_03250 [Spirochaetaceae bacterium 4572_59]
MRAIELGNADTGESQLYLEALDSVEKNKIKKALSTLRTVLKNVHSEDENYKFHTTFLRVERPLLCRYDNMMEFFPV